MRLACHGQPFNVFKGLDFGPDVFTVDDLHVAGHGSYFGVFEVPDAGAQRVAGQLGVAIHVQNKVTACQGHARVQSLGFAAIGFGDHTHTNGGGFPRHGTGFFIGVVGGAIVDHNDLKVGVVQLQQGANRSLNHQAFIEGRHYQGNHWQ